MKKFKIGSFIFAFVLFLSAITLCLTQFSYKNKEELSASAKTFTTKTLLNTNAEIPNDASYTAEGGIPFTLYTSQPNGTNRDIISYYASYNESSSTDSTTARTIYYYTIDEETIPYIMLTSTPDRTIIPEDVISDNDVQRTIYFKFNDLDFKPKDTKTNTDKNVSIPNKAGYMSIEAFVNGTPIIADKTPSPSTDNTELIFPINLLPVENENCKCPSLLDGESLLGGNGQYNDVSFRTGLYEFKIRYSYRNDDTTEISNECIFQTAFYVLDYYTYVKETGGSAVSFTHADTYTYSNATVTNERSDYHIFNYNYTTAPVVELDATKFAFNFLYTTSYLNYNFKYINLNSLYTKYTVNSVPFGTKTGNITVKLDDSELIYTIPTYKVKSKVFSIAATQENPDNEFTHATNDKYFAEASDVINVNDNNYLSSSSKLVWVDENNNGTYDLGDWFYIEKNSDTTSSDYGKYNYENDLIWIDSNNNGMLDELDKFLLDSNNNGEIDLGETIYDKNTYKFYISKIEVGYLTYYARFNLQDFETNFLAPNKINTTFLGTYSFCLDFLIQNSLGGFSIFNSSLVPNASRDVTSQKLIAFGYNLKYYDQDPTSSTYRQNVELKNDTTWTSWLSYNTMTVGNETIDVQSESPFTETGNMKNVPTAIAITNQAPLRFDYFGNLSGSNYSSSFLTYDYKTNDEKSFVEYFRGMSSSSDVGTYGLNFTIDSVKPYTYVDTNKDTLVDFSGQRSYYQGAAISSDSIYIFKLTYKINVTVDIERQIEGCQYFVFEINNTIQNLYIQSLKYNNETNKDKVVESYDFNKYTNRDVRINIEYKKNTFFVPVTVQYYYYKDYSLSSSYQTGTLNLKTETVLEDNETITRNLVYKIDEKDYNYYVLNNSNLYSFTASGAYKITIKNSISNVPVTYYFTIDKDPFSGISTNMATLSGSNYVIDEALSTTVLSNKTKLNEFDMIVSCEAITMGWSEKASGANSYSYVYYMEMLNDTNLEKTLFEVENESWLTNGYKLKSPSGAIDTFLNFKAQSDYMNKYLRPESYFNKEGIYIFYVYDEAGNFFTRTVLIDNTLGRVLQGYWEEDEWHESFDPITNKANYVNVDTTLYFGSHKAIALPDMSVENNVQFDDISYVRAYSYKSEENPNTVTKTGRPIDKQPIVIDLYGQILNLYTSFVKGTTNSPTIKQDVFSELSNYYYLTLSNILNSYTRIYEDGEDESGAPIAVEAKGTIDEISYSKIYKSQATAMKDFDNYEIAEKYKFYGEAEYNYIVSNINGLKFSRNVAMNFDVVRGTFYAYNKTDNATSIDRLIRKNSGTNLDVLKFEYDNIEGETAPYYALSELSYKYYGFVLDESSPNFNNSFYPFSREVTREEQILDSKVPSADKKQFIINGINLNASGVTQPGKYVLTRIYVGGDYEYTGTNDDYLDENNYQYVGTGGSYYKNSDGKFINLFEDDTLVRKYVVYVDHYGIISTEYMIRNDNTQYVREVGNFISLTLNNTFNDQWEFKEFFLTSTASLSLNTNKVPVKINIPLSKFFVFYNSSTNNLYAKQSFAKLDITISYQASPTTAWKRYKIDGFDSKGMCTCSKLPNGQLIFSAAGTYVIYIEDHTGYLDITSYAENASNLDPTTYEYSFTILHNAPEATAKDKTYNYTENKFNNEQNLSNIYNDKVLATNIKEENYVSVGTISEEFFNSSFEEGSTIKYYTYNNDTFTAAKSDEYSSSTVYYIKKENNELLLTWSDPLTPYQAKIKQITIKSSYINAQKRLVSETYTIDLLARTEEGNLIYNLKQLATNATTLTYDAYTFIKYFKISFYNDVSTPSIYDHQEYDRFSYRLSLSLNTEYQYQITLSYVSNSLTNQSYKDEKGVSYADSDYTIYVDRTKPNTNINLLLNAETYLTSSGYYTPATINDFKEENFDVSLINLQKTPSAFTYTFAISNDFKLTYNNEETMPYFFVRSYNKYNYSSTAQGSNYSSITPDMVDSVYNEDKSYYDRNLTTKFPAYYPRFSEINTASNIISIGNDNWYKINYQNNASLRNLIISATKDNNPVGFYEIIERDLAGNYRCFTVYFNEYSSIFLNVNIDGYTQKNNVVYLISTGDDAKKDNISTTVTIELTELYSHLGWGTLTIRNETAGIDYGSIMLTPFDEINDSRLEPINTFLNTKFDSKFSFKLATYNANYRTAQLSRYINFDIDGEGKLGRPIIEEYINASTGEALYNIVLPAYDNTSILYLEEFTLNKITIANSRLFETTLNQYGSKELVPNKITGLSKGIYRAIYKDNFNDNDYYYILHIGEFYLNDFDKEYSFEFNGYQKVYNADVKDYVYYSGGKVYVTYESNIYNVYVNNILYSGTNKEDKSLSYSQCKTFVLSPAIEYDDIQAQDSVGSYDDFIIEYKDVIDGSIGKTTLRLRIYNVLPEILLTNAYGGEVTSTLEESDTQIISSVVTMNWGYLTFDEKDFEYFSLNAFNASTLTADDRDDIVDKDIISATLYKKNDFGQYRENITNCKRGQVVTDEGYYKLVLKNSLLNNYREIYFAISFTDVPLYSVFANGERIYASQYESLDFTYGSYALEQQDNNLKSEGDLIINRLYYGIGHSNKITLTDDEKTSVYKQLGFNTSTFNKDNIGICNLTNVPHFYSIYTPKIVYNSNIDLRVIEFTFKNGGIQLNSVESVTEFDDATGLSVNNQLLKLNSVGVDYWTTIFLVFNLDGPIRIEFFAFTRVPKTSSLLQNSLNYYNEVENTIDTINFPTNQITYTLTNREIKNSDIELMWTPTLSTTLTWYNQGNVVIAADQYGVSKYSHNLDCEYHKTGSSYLMSPAMSTIITGSGVHKLTFKDVAGNIHEFASNTYYPQNYYTINLIDSVIYHINVKNNDYNPIQYGVFNDPLNIVLDEQFISYYSEFKIEIIKNGISYKAADFLSEGKNYSYTFSTPGKYVVTLSAAYGQQKYPLNDATYNFSIINSSSARLAYEFVEMNGYEILEVIRSGQDITDNFRDARSGKVLSLFISSNSSNSGNGYYDVTLKYGKNKEDVISYSFLINDFIPTISCNVKHGETTTANIILSYNPSIIYEQLGECNIKILTYNNDSKTFNSNATIIPIDIDSITTPGARTTEITRSNSYFVQVETASGNILTSFRVNKKDPLNAIAIIIIVIVAVTIVVITIVIIKLRTRMRIK